MYTILEKVKLNKDVIKIVIEAPLVAKRCKAGQFIILRSKEDSERLPFTIADFNRDKGTVTIIVQIVGAGTKELDSLNHGDKLATFVGPLGKPTEIENIQNAIVIGGGLGSAIAYPLAKALHENNTNVTSIVGFRNKDLIILEEEFKSVSNNLIITTDDGSNGLKGFVTTRLEEQLASIKAPIDCVFVIGPLRMMQAVCKITQEKGIKTIVSMNPLMVDGTGMCGGCRITVDGKIKFACVDGPDFDGAKVDFEEAISRNNIYRDFEKHHYEEACNLLNKQVEVK